MLAGSREVIQESHTLEQISGENQRQIEVLLCEVSRFKVA
jgi:hypothetical protein